MGYTGAIVIGIASSLIATTAFLGFSELIRSVVLPWYADHIYRGVRLDGKWRACRLGHEAIESNSTNYCEFDLKQKGDRVTGISTLLVKDEPKPTLYKMRGQVRDGYFSATAWPLAPDMVDAMACLFRVFHEDKKLRIRGCLSVLNPKTAQIEGAGQDIEFCKDPS